MHCTVTAFGRSGELSWLPPYDGVVEARSGANVDLGATLGRETPRTAPRPNPSYGAANIAVQSIAAALLVREHDGRGQHIDTSLYQGLLVLRFLQRPAPAERFRRARPAAAGHRRRLGPFLPYLPVRCQDGQWMQITNNTARLFRHWMEVIGLAHICDRSALEGRPVGLPDLEAKVELSSPHPGPRCRPAPSTSGSRSSCAEGLTGDRFLTTQQAPDHPQVLHNGSVIEAPRPRTGPDPSARPTVGSRTARQRPDGRSATRRRPDRVAPPATASPRAARRPRTSRCRPARSRACRRGSSGHGQPPRSVNGHPPARQCGRTARWPGCWCSTSHLAGRALRHVAARRHGRQVVDQDRAAPATTAAGAIDGRAHLPGQGEPGLDLKSRKAGGHRQLLARPTRSCSNMARGDAAARLGIDSEPPSTEPGRRLPVRRLSLRLDRPGRRPGRVPPDDGALSGGVLRQVGRGNEPPAGDVPLDEEARYQYSQRMIRSNEASPTSPAPSASRPR